MSSIEVLDSFHFDMTPFPTARDLQAPLRAIGFALAFENLIVPNDCRRFGFEPFH